jgi:hypothetical protein
MNELGKKWLLWISLIIILLSVGVIVYFSIIKSKSIFIWMSIIALISSGLNLTALFSFRYQERKWLRYTAKFSLFLLPLFSLAIYLLSNYTNVLDSELAGIFSIIVICISILFALIYIFVIREAEEIRGVLVLLLLIVISVVLQRFDFSISVVEDLFFPGFVILAATGMYMYGVRCLFLVEKNNYLKVFSFLACILTSIGSFAFLFKMLRGQADILELIYFIPAFLMTLIVLLTLPISGYITWISLHKRILKKIMISWIFFLLIFSIRFVFPDFFKTVVFIDKNPTQEFIMIDYKLVNKNGLEPD